MQPLSHSEEGIVLSFSWKASPFLDLFPVSYRNLCDPGILETLLEVTQIFLLFIFLVIT